ncbi:hypothetical protein DL93DRAFT_1213154 [Clavulina sp. PMI_390]|nr:hypothetical protein DL93DRAFT_1213154 [Clavulina sp. PMI_390]
MSNISALPTELLQQIFILSVPLVIHTEWSPIIPFLDPHRPICSIDSVQHRSHLSTALATSYVCRQWRLISLSLRELWSYVIVPLPETSISETSILQWQINRAGTCALNLEVEVSEAQDYDGDATSRLLELILKLLPRCRSLHIPTIPQNLYTQIFPLRGQLPILEAIYIEICQSTAGGTTSINPILENSAVAPVLKRLHFSYFNYTHLHLIENINFSRLREFWMGPL